MSSCKNYHKLIQKLITGFLDETETAQLNEHRKTCRECNSLLTVHKELSDSDNPVLLPESSEFYQMRQNVLRKIRISKDKKSFSIIDRFLFLTRKPAFAYSLALLCILGGFLIGKYSLADRVINNGTFIKQIDYVAANNHDLKQVENSPYTFSNISMEHLDDKQVHLSFNVTTHMDLVRPKTDPLVTEILAQSLINPEPTGYRIRNMSYAEKIMDPKIKEALIFSLQNDPAMPVRLKALLNLMQYRNDDDIQSALLKVVRDEESVQMRLLAIDYLTENKIDASLLNQAAETSSLDNKSPILVKTRQYDEVKNHY